MTLMRRRPSAFLGITCGQRWLVPHRRHSGFIDRLIVWKPSKAGEPAEHAPFNRECTALPQ